VATPQERGALRGVLLAKVVRDWPNVAAADREALAPRIRTTVRLPFQNAPRPFALRPTGTER
jgi:hypothetical protein